jgi:AcrR family transcriptional regulator
MARNAEQTRQRLLEAAAEEFSALGIAGARVDRIAQAAECNKAMIYTYFGSKDQLFDAVFTLEVADRIAEVTFDPTDLPSYAGRLFDCFDDRPTILRLYTWYNLERPGGPSLQAIGLANNSKLTRLQQAQDAGTVSDHYAAVELLTLVRSIAATWALLSHSSLGAFAPAERERRRHTVVDAVQRLVRPD